MKFRVSTRCVFVLFSTILSGQTISAESHVGAPADFPNKVVPDLYNGQVTHNPMEDWVSGTCSRVFVENQDGNWVIGSSKDFGNEKTERVEICIGSTKKDGVFDILKASVTSKSNCSTRFVYGKEEYKYKAARKEGYFDCNSQFKETGLFSTAITISKEKFGNALESPAISAEGKNIFKDVFSKYFSSAMKGDANDAKTLLIRFWPYLTQTNTQELLVAFGKKTALKEFPLELVAHADEEVIQTAKKQVREFWELVYKKQIGTFLSPEADLKKLESKINDLSAENKTRWSQEDFDNALPNLQKVAVALKVQIEKREQQAAQQAAQEAREQQLQMEQKIALFRNSIQIGSWTNCGQVYDVRKPMIGVQTMIGQQYIDINRLFPQGFGCHFKNGIYFGTSGG